MKKTKIVCTLGPGSNSQEIMENMLLEGMNVARINLSHGKQEDYLNLMEKFRNARDRVDVAAAILLDTRGPEIRTKEFEKNEIDLVEGQEFTLWTGDEKGSQIGVGITYPKLPEELKKDDIVMIDDGKIMLTVVNVDKEQIKCVVNIGGTVSNHKGINVPSVHLNMDYIGEKDRNDIIFGIKNNIDYLAASFVRKKEDVQELRYLLSENGGGDIKIISKIENMEGIENFEEILQASDGIMVARGDMGVEIEYEKLPGIQKRLIKRCQQSGKIVITATQMLESMIKNERPTRAEITDVANAVFDGTTAVMLSGETAMGKYPVEAVKAMAKIAVQAEIDSVKVLSKDVVWHEMDADDTTNAVGHAACTMAIDIKAKAILAVTKSGYTAVRMAKFRPNITIIGATPYEKIYNQMALIWGVVPMLTENEKDLEELLEKTISGAKKRNYLAQGDRVVISGGLPLNITGNTNLIKVEVVK